MSLCSSTYSLIISSCSMSAIMIPFATFSSLKLQILFWTTTSQSFSPCTNSSLFSSTSAAASSGKWGKKGCHFGWGGAGPHRTIKVFYYFHHPPSSRSSCFSLPHAVLISSFSQTSSVLISFSSHVLSNTLTDLSFRFSTHQETKVWNYKETYLGLGEPTRTLLLTYHSTIKDFLLVYNNVLQSPLPS